MRYAFRLIVLMSLGVLSASCEEDQGAFATCPFDPCLYEQCSERAGSGTTAGGTRVAFSCAIPEHPICEEGVCLIFGEQSEDCGEGKACQSGPFCTRVCETNEDCPAGSSCESVGPNLYCVPPASQRPAPLDDPGECRVSP